MEKVINSITSTEFENTTYLNELKLKKIKAKDLKNKKELKNGRKQNE